MPHTAYSATGNCHRMSPITEMSPLYVVSFCLSLSPRMASRAHPLPFCRRASSQIVGIAVHGLISCVLLLVTAAQPCDLSQNHGQGQTKLDYPEGRPDGQKWMHVAGRSVKGKIRFWWPTVFYRLFASRVGERIREGPSLLAAAICVARLLLEKR
ncbi:hypothetical protein LIA77_03850 [Sarocladium implicatum]|nr:hypothetical protein LIA77_03850 [Sarocladium implicatum]